MPTRCLNKVSLIGNLTRDPELRYTPGGMAVASLGVATNRSWTTKQGERKEDAQFHRIVAWNKLAELCSQLLAKGMRVYVEGRLQYREWTGQDGQKRQVAEIVISDMVVLSPNKNSNAGNSENNYGASDTRSSASGDVGDGLDDIVIPDEEIDLGDNASEPVVDEVKIDKKVDKKTPKAEEKKEEKKEEGDMPF